MDRTECKARAAEATATPFFGGFVSQNDPFGGAFRGNLGHFGTSDDAPHAGL